MKNFVLSRFEASQIAHQGIHSKCNRWHDQYRGIIARGAQSYRNQIHIPFILSSVQSFVARLVQTLFGTYPYVGFQGLGPDDAGNARRNETLITAQLYDSDSFEKAYTFMLHAALFGTGVCRVGWRTTTQWQKRRQYIPGTQQEFVVPELVTHFDGPDWEPVHMRQFFPQPGVQRIKDMGWAFHEYYKDLDEMKRMAMGDQPYFIPAAIRELEKYPMVASDQNNATMPMSRWEALQQEPKGKPCRIREMWGFVPKEFAIEGFDLVCIAIANERVIVKYDSFPFWHGDLSKVFISYSPMPAPEDFHGMGLAEISEKLAVVANKLASQKLDALEVSMDPMWWVNESLGISGPILTRAGKMISVNGPVDDSMVKQFSPDLRGMEHAYPEIATLYSYIQMGGGITEDVAGLDVTGNRQTAREFLGKQENALTRIALCTQLAEKGWLEPLANTYRALNRQFLQVPKIAQMLGPTAFFNPRTGQPMPPEPAVVSLDDVNMDYRALAYGSSQMLGKAIRQQNYMGFLQSAGAIMGVVGPLAPALIMSVNWMALLKEGAELFDFKNLNEIFNDIPAVQAAGGLGGAGGAPSAPGAVGQTQLPMLSPDIIGNQLGGSLTDFAPTQS